MPIDFNKTKTPPNSTQLDPNEVLNFLAETITPNKPPQNEQNIMLRYLNESCKYDDDILFRENITKELMSVLLKKDKPNAILVGPNGVGKTKIIEDLAQKIKNKHPLVPEILHDLEIYELRLSELVAGTGLVGALEEKLQELIDFLNQDGTDRVLFIDEIHLLKDEKLSNQYQSVAEILKPALARGEISLIGATTTNEYKNIEKDPAFKRRFSRIDVPEFDKDQTLHILKHVKKDFEDHYQLKIALYKNALEDIYEYSKTHKTKDLHQPDLSLTLYDQVLADYVVNQKPKARINVKPEHVKYTTSKQTKDSFDKDLFQKNTSHILGQDHVLKKLENLLTNYKKPIFPKKKPLSLLFLGNSGLGKTEIAKQIAKTLNDSKLIYLNMSEYTSKTSEQRFLGVDNGYVGSESKKERPFDILESNPNQVILLDEFEKAHPEIQNTFMQALDEGFLTDAQGRIIDFSKSIIILTSNAGYNKTNKTLGFANQSTQASKKDLNLHLNPALTNRIKHIYHFNQISRDDFKNILSTTYKRKYAEILDKTYQEGLATELDQATLELLADKYYDQNEGARMIETIIETYIYDKLSE